MAMRHGMPVWAPDDRELSKIARRISMERAKAAREVLRSARQLFRNEYEAACPVVRAKAPKQA